VARANGEPLAGCAGAVWAVVDGVQPVLALAGRRDLGSDPGGRPAARGHRGQGGLERPVRGRDGDPRAPARRWCKGGAPATEALGKSQGGFSTKVHLKAEGQGQPLTVLLTPGQQHESTVFEPLMHRGAIRRPGRGRPRLRPCRVAGDKGYTGRRTRAGLRRRGIRQTIPKLSTEDHSGPFDRATYRRRHLVENLIARCKQYRALATRYDKRADSYRTAWVIVMTILWLPG
jgi:transposase